MKTMNKAVSKLGVLVYRDKCTMRFVNWVRYFIPNFIHTVKRIWAWAPIIRKDRWWDYSFLLQIMAFKLKLDANKYEKLGLSICNDKKVRNMRMCASLFLNVAKGRELVRPPAIGEFSKSKGLEYCDYLDNRDIDYAFKIMKKHIWGWWD